MLTAYPAIGGPLPKLAPLVADGLRACGCEVETLGWSAHSAGHESFAAKVLERSVDLARVHRHLRSFRPDVVYVATAHNRTGLLRDLPLVLSVRRGRPPLVLHLHGSEADRLGAPGQGVYTALSLLLVRRAAAVMLLSSEERAIWQRRCPGVTFDVVLNPFVAPAIAAAVDGAAHRDGAAAARGNGSGPRPACLLTVARLIPEKGVFDLVDALALVARERPCRLVVAGTGPARDELVSRAAARGLADRVEVRGYLAAPELERAYREADAFVLPTYFAEGFPLSVMEAMGHGLPIVTTPIRGCADYLRADEHALFVPARDPAALARALERLLGDDALRARMSAANRARVADFAPARVMPHYAGILQAAAAAARSPVLESTTA
jgi:glycosyltransferase involved in cell wall biosynthesis